MSDIIHIFTDGSCNAIDRSGGWAFVLVRRDQHYARRYDSGEEIDKEGRGHHPGDQRIIQSGARRDTTTNQMELTAIVRSLQFIHRQERDEDGNLLFRKIRIYTDSSYSKHSLTKWVAGWMRSGWVNTYGEPVKNQDLIKTGLSILRDLRSRKADGSIRMAVALKKVKGHSGDYYNEMADTEAGAARKEMLSLID